jgi:hypothetical protein
MQIPGVTPRTRASMQNTGSKARADLSCTATRLTCAPWFYKTTVLETPIPLKVETVLQAHPS